MPAKQPWAGPPSRTRPRRASQAFICIGPLSSNNFSIRNLHYLKVGGGGGGPVGHRAALVGEPCLPQRQGRPPVPDLAAGGHQGGVDELVAPDLLCLGFYGVFGKRFVEFRTSNLGCAWGPHRELALNLLALRRGVKTFGIP